MKKDDLRTEMIKVKLSQAELEVILSKARATGLSVSSFLRMLGIKSSVTVSSIE